MPIAFEKYHGAGNDFVVIDDRNRHFDTEDVELIRRICHRRFGVGSDGLMLIRLSVEADFEMLFFNPDGSESLCGNGSRCSVDFARKLKICGDFGKMITTDGVHRYRIKNGMIGISMADVTEWIDSKGGIVIDTGSPHLVLFEKDVEAVDVMSVGRKLRYDPEYESGNGVNVNFVSPGEDGHYRMRTYERGVEAETLSCGTGATAAALAVALKFGISRRVSLQAPGGVLTVDFDEGEKGFSNIWLTGPVKHVFSGVYHA